MIFGGVLKAPEKESMEAQIILNRDVPLTLYGKVVKPVRFLLVYTYNFERQLTKKEVF